MKKLDIVISNANKCRVLVIDFGKTLDLFALEKDNSSIDNNSIIYIFFIIKNQGKVFFINSTIGAVNKIIVNNYNKWIFFDDIQSKGKKNNHVFDNIAL